MSPYKPSRPLTLGDGREATEQLRATIQMYNRDDCLSALRLRDWLEDRRREEEMRSGHLLSRPAPKPREPRKKLKEHRVRVEGLKKKFLADLPSDQTTLGGGAVRALAARPDVGLASSRGEIDMVGILPAVRTGREGTAGG